MKSVYEGLNEEYKNITKEVAQKVLEELSVDTNKDIFSIIDNELQKHNIFYDRKHIYEYRESRLSKSISTNTYLPVTLNELIAICIDGGYEL